MIEAAKITDCSIVYMPDAILSIKDGRKTPTKTVPSKRMALIILKGIMIFESLCCSTKFFFKNLTFFIILCIISTFSPIVKPCKAAQI